MTLPNYPLLFTPVYKDYIWGGSLIASRYGRVGAPDVAAESWEISDRPEGMSVVENGPLAGQSLQSLLAVHASALLGKVAAARGVSGFPLLVKLIDAAQPLSVQVHPHDDNVALCGGEAKTECWYVLDAKPGAQVMAGFVPNTTAARFRQALADKKAATLLQAFTVRRGDLIYIPGGRIHAIGAGCLILEVQQNSNTTYRLYDWERLGPDGKPRALHVEQALRAIRWNDPTPSLTPPAITRTVAPGVNLRTLIACAHFRLERVAIEGPWTPPAADAFQAWFATDGNLRLHGAGFDMLCPHGRTVLIPAAAREITVSPERGTAAEAVRIMPGLE